MFEQLATLLSGPLRGTAGLILLAMAAYLADIAAQCFLARGLEQMAIRSKHRWDDALATHRVFKRSAHLVPLVVIAFGVPLLPGLNPDLAAVIVRGAAAAIAVVVAVAVNNLLAALHAVYTRRPGAAQRPIKGYVQLLQLLVGLLAAIVAVALLLDRSPVGLLSGIGALTAVLMLVFKDTLLGLVASVQIAQQDLIRMGDWIEAPHLNADGNVIDMALHTIKVCNWDNTITSVPAYRLIDEGFKNWRGMSESGVRRIKRALLLDVTSIRHLDENQLRELQRWQLLTDYLSAKLDDIARFNAEQHVDGNRVPHRRRLTNIGTLRAYIDAYLRHHPGIAQERTLMVRQLAATPQGLPLEIYCFSSTTAWAEYEAIQSDIFDHLYAVLDAFGLRAFQVPAGADIRMLRA